MFKKSIALLFTVISMSILFASCNNVGKATSEAGKATSEMLSRADKAVSDTVSRLESDAENTKSKLEENESSFRGEYSEVVPEDEITSSMA